MTRFQVICVYLFIFFITADAKVEMGIDRFFKEGEAQRLKNKKVALLTNHTGRDSQYKSSVDLFIAHAHDYSLVAIFVPEHGLTGSAYAFDKIEHSKTKEGIPIWSLHGDTRRPTAAMLKDIDVIIYDLQDIGLRCYTYSTTLFYVMEEAAKKGIEVIVLDRPNPLGGLIVDGPMLHTEWRSFIGYINVPYCHGMTIGELARFFNDEYQIKAKLKVVSMRGWHRDMDFDSTGLLWIPTSPHVPEADSPLFMATTGILGELGIVSIGVGYTLPFKCIGTPWMDADKFAAKLNSQKMPGVYFLPHHFRPFYGAYKGEECHGVLLHITDKKIYRPLMVQYLLIGMLKSMYPEQIVAKLNSLDKTKKNLFCKANGNEEMLKFLQEERYVAWKLIEFDQNERKEFLNIRKKYLLY